MDILPIGGLLDDSHGPLTAEDIAFIEEGIDELICDLFQDEKDQAEELAMDLPYKIEGYITIADYAANDPRLKNMPGAAEAPALMRQLLKRVNEYFHRLN